MSICTVACRNLSAEQVAAKLQAGEKATLRFQVPRDQIIEFIDLIKGPQKFAANDIGDFIIRRNDGSASFMFCNAIDDAEMQVSHALRGDDHLTNTPRQIMILNALNLPVPNYGHFAMINGNDGAPLSKRNGSEAVRELRSQGYHPLAVINYLARLGHYYASNDFMTLPELSANFDLKHGNNNSWEKCFLSTRRGKGFTIYRPVIFKEGINTKVCSIKNSACIRGSHNKS